AMACPLFVPLVEEGWLKGRVVKEVVQTYLKPLKQSRVDTLILGCTHYPILKPIIREVMGPNVTLIDSAKQVAIEVKETLSSHGMLETKRRGRIRFYVSDNPEWFKELAGRFLGTKVDCVTKVNNSL
ncbi:MAG: glutamate racemase, partial [Candidatus Omnitrophica bacterium]|nr:glutamate racemase [Candidatus Omnitrophota bacterium]